MSSDRRIKNPLLINAGLQILHSGGTSVYGARVMLNLDISDNYTEPVQRLRNPKTTTYTREINSIGKIIPNPNSGTMEYHAKLTPKTKGLLEIYDQLGNLVKSFILYPEVKQLKIDLSDFAAGGLPLSHHSR